MKAKKMLFKILLPTITALTLSSAAFAKSSKPYINGIEAICSTRYDEVEMCEYKNVYFIKITAIGGDDTYMILGCGPQEAKKSLEDLQDMFSKKDGKTYKINQCGDFPNLHARVYNNGIEHSIGLRNETNVCECYLYKEDVGYMIGRLNLSMIGKLGAEIVQKDSDDVDVFKKIK